MKAPDLYVCPIVDSVFVAVPADLTPEVEDPHVGGQVIEGKVLIAARMRPLAQALDQAVLDAMKLIPQPAQVKKRVVTAATWSVFMEPDKMAAWDLPHDCASCREGRDTLTQYLRDNPGRAVAACRLEFQEHIEAFKVGTVGTWVQRGGAFTGDAIPEKVVAGENCSTCGDRLDPHEMWLFGDPSEPGCPPGRITCPVEGCQCQYDFSLTVRS